MVNNNNIIVVGAGLAGLAASIGLANLGYEVDLVEKLHSFDRRGTALSLAPNGVKALNEIFQLDHNDDEGSVEELCSQGIVIPQYQRYLLGWWMVRDFLLQKVLQNNNNNTIRLYTGWDLDTIVDEPNEPNIQATFRRTNNNNNKMDNDIYDYNDNNNTENSTLTLNGSMLIAADGVRSKVRQILDLPMSKDTNKTLWRGTFLVPKDCSVLEPLLSKGFIPLRDTKLFKPHVKLQLFNFHEKQKRLIAFSATTSIDINNNNNNENNDNNKYNMQKLFEKEFQNEPSEDLHIFQKVCTLIDEFDLNNPIPIRAIDPKAAAKTTNNKKYCFHRYHRRRRGGGGGGGWGGQGRIALIGDAAHAIRPAGGFGASLAFEDVAMLCRYLKKKNNKKNNNQYKSWEQLIYQFEQSRIKRVSKIWHHEWEMAEYIYKHQTRKKVSPKFYEWIYRGI